MVKDREACHAAVHGVAKSQAWLSDWSTTTLEYYRVIWNIDGGIYICVCVYIYIYVCVCVYIYMWKGDPQKMSEKSIKIALSSEFIFNILFFFSVVKKTHNINFTILTIFKYTVQGC